MRQLSPAPESRSTPTRVFLVGYPRSGTTLLQSLLAAHPQLVSFPETHFFPTAVAHERLRRAVGLASPRAPEALAQLAALGIIEGDPQDHLRRFVTLGQYARRLTTMLDLAATRAGATHWLEKTPDHLHYVREIQRHIPRSRFIHMIREGQAAIASFFRVKQEYPELGGSPTLGDVIDEWRSDVHRSMSWVGQPDHTFVSYERLVANPHRVLLRLCEAIDLPVSNGRVDQMVRERAAEQHRLMGYVRDTPGGYVVRQEPWKQTLAQPIENRNRETFMATFGSRDRALIDRVVASEERAAKAFPFV